MPFDFSANLKNIFSFHPVETALAQGKVSRPTNRGIPSVRPRLLSSPVARRILHHAVAARTWRVFQKSRASFVRRHNNENRTLVFEGSGQTTGFIRLLAALDLPFRFAGEIVCLAFTTAKGTAKNRKIPRKVQGCGNPAGEESLPDTAPR